MSYSVQTLWAECLDRVSIQVSQPAFLTWFGPLRALSLVEGHESLEIRLETPGPWFQQWIENRYDPLLRGVLEQLTGQEIRISYQLKSEHVSSRTWPHLLTTKETGHNYRIQEADDMSFFEPHRSPSVMAPVVRFTGSPLNPAYTFETFVEGTSNKEAREAGYSIVTFPGQLSANPLFIYGGAGLGKTHLVQAIAHAVTARNCGMRQVYVSSEQFTSDFLLAVQRGAVSDFSSLYRHLDVLIVDDIQFFSGKETIQDQFYSLFNELYQAGKQVILCADRPPRDLPDIQERLLSRLEGGRQIEIFQPDFDTRLAVLRKKAVSFRFVLPHDVAYYVARQVTSNMRELEGALLKLVAKNGFQHEPIDVRNAEKTLHDLIGRSPAHLEIEDIQRVVADYFRMPAGVLLSKSRKREIVGARQVAMYLCKQLTTHTLEHIGIRFGGRDHTTVIHACTAVQDRMDVEPSFGREVDRIRLNLDSRKAA